MYVLRQSGCKCAPEDLFRVLAVKSLDHGELLPWRGSIVKRY
jgi:hypothetical protein